MLTVFIGVCVQPRIQQNYTKFCYYSIKKNFMTLVYRSPKFVQKCVEDTPGPTSYTQHTQKKSKQSSSCFKSKVMRQQCEQKATKKIGPGSYFLPGEPEPSSQHKAVFMSKIQRFKEKEVMKQQCENNQFSQELNSVLKKEDRCKEIPGRLVKTDQRLKKARQVMPQRLPSIPSQEQSYGYRIDQNTQKLVYNDNPKIIFAQKMPTKEEVHFQRTSNSMGKGVKCWFSGNSKRLSPQLKHQIDIPTSTHYSIDKVSSIEGNMKHCNSTLTSFKDRFENVQSNRDKLLLIRMKKYFKDYLPQNMTAQELQNQKMKDFLPRSSLEKKEGSNKKLQCFLTKEQRFNIRKCQNKPLIQEKEEEEKVQQVKKKKQPFALGQDRFKQDDKQNIGPGSYNQSSKRSNSYSITRNQQRFKSPTNIKTPGPGAYNTLSPKYQQQKVKTSFNHFSSISLQQDNRNSQISTMEDMYGKVGKQLNYFSKIGKVGQKGTSKHCKEGKEDQKKKEIGMSTVQNKLKKVMQSLQNKSQEMQQEQARCSPHKKHIMSHLYEYKKPPKYESPLGPGCYQISSTLQKKSFNKSSPPEYQQ